MRTDPAVPSLKRPRQAIPRDVCNNFHPRYIAGRGQTALVVCRCINSSFHQVYRFNSAQAQTSLHLMMVWSTRDHTASSQTVYSTLDTALEHRDYEAPDLSGGQLQAVTAERCLYVGAGWCAKRARGRLLGALRALRSASCPRLTC